MRKIFLTIASLFFFMVVPFACNASTLFFMPQNTEHQKSETFIKTLYVDTEDQKINTIKSKINFDQNILEVIDIITGDSIIKFWVETPAISNKDGTIKFIGGIPNGYSGKGVILKIIFKAKQEGNNNLNISDTKVLLNDIKATEDKIIFLNDSCNIIKKSDNFIKITSNSHPNQDKWYNNNTVNLHWNLIDEVKYSYILSRDSLAEPDEISDKPEGELVWMGDISYEGLEDGIYYFHLKQKLPNEKSWSLKATVRIMIDTTIPEKFIPQIIDIEGKKYLVFPTTDTPSGIDRYEVLEVDLNWFGNIKSEQENKWEIVKTPYLIKDQDLKNNIKIKVIDKANNERLSEIILSSKPKFFTKQIIFLILVIITIIISVIWKLFLRRNKNKK